MKKIKITTSNYFDNILQEYQDKIQTKYQLKNDTGSAYIETDDTIGEVVDFFIENVYPQLVVQKDKELGLWITIYDGYLE